MWDFFFKGVVTVSEHQRKKGRQPFKQPLLALLARLQAVRPKVRVLIGGWVGGWGENHEYSTGGLLTIAPI